jgi:hypothetical protein
MVMLHGTLQRAPRPWIADWRCAPVIGIVLELVQRQEYLDTTNAEKYSEYF